MHGWEYLSEYIGTLLVIVVLVPTVAWFFPAHTPVSRLLPSIYVRLFLIGSILGGAGWAIAVTPPGKLSGAHLNPALSFGYWLLGKMRWSDLIGYIVAQLGGAATGASIGVVLTGARAEVANDGALVPGAGLNLAQVWAGELSTTLALTFIIYTSTSLHRLRRFTPALSTLSIAVLVTLDGTYSGAGMSPSRWFGPALADGRWAFWPAYIFGPIAGATAAAFIRRSSLVRHNVPHTAKIVHDERYRSIFLGDTVPSARSDAPR